LRGQSWDAGKSLDHRDESGRMIFGIDSQGTCPPENCGGPGVYANFCEAINNPKHPDHAEMKDWIVAIVGLHGPATGICCTLIAIKPIARKRSGPHHCPLRSGTGTITSGHRTGAAAYYSRQKTLGGRKKSSAFTTTPPLSKDLSDYACLATILKSNNAMLSGRF